MTRTLTILFLGALAVAATGCGAPAAQSGAAEAPATREAEPSICKTPEGATRESPPQCSTDCVFDPETVRCVEANRGIIINQ